MQETQTKFGFLSDLDDYFCENYANYDKLCVIEGYRVPKMQATERREDGRLYSYTLPASTMRLAKQENRAEILEVLKSKIKDKNFSFSFEPAGFFTRLLKYKKYSFKHDDLCFLFDFPLFICARRAVQPRKRSRKAFGKSFARRRNRTWKNIFK